MSRSRSELQSAVVRFCDQGAQLLKLANGLRSVEVWKQDAHLVSCILHDLVFVSWGDDLHDRLNQSAQNFWLGKRQSEDPESVYGDDFFSVSAPSDSFPDTERSLSFDFDYWEEGHLKIVGAQEAEYGQIRYSVEWVLSGMNICQRYTDSIKKFLLVLQAMQFDGYVMLIFNDKQISLKPQQALDRFFR